MTPRRDVEGEIYRRLYGEHGHSQHTGPPLEYEDEPRPAPSAAQTGAGGLRDRLGDAVTAARARVHTTVIAPRELGRGSAPGRGRNGGFAGVALLVGLLLLAAIGALAPEGSPKSSPERAARPENPTVTRSESAAKPQKRRPESRRPRRRRDRSDAAAARRGDEPEGTEARRQLSIEPSGPATAQVVPESEPEERPSSDSRRLMCFDGLGCFEDDEAQGASERRAVVVFEEEYSADDQEVTIDELEDIQVPPFDD